MAKQARTGSFGYAWEKFHLAVDGIAGSTRPLQERLAGAYMYHIMHVAMPPNDDVPEEIREELAALRKAVTRVAAVGDEGNVTATTRKMKEEEARKWIASIVSMYDTITRYQPR